jgi:hypothetical protein
LARFAFAPCSVAALLACAPAPAPTPALDAVTSDVISDAPSWDFLDPTTRDTGLDYGVCGPGVYECRCACMGDSGAAVAACRQACNQDHALCSDCLAAASARCCPGATAAVTACSAGAMLPSDAGPACTTSQCVRTRCAGELTALNTCITTMNTTDAACHSDLVGCVGPATCM